MIDHRNNEQFVSQPLQENFNLIKELNELLVNKDDFNNEEGNEMLMRIESYLETEQRLLEAIFATSPTDVEKEVNTTYFELPPILERVKAWVWRTTSEEDKKYIINVDKEGEYKIWLRRDPLELPQDVDPKDITFSLTVDGISYNNKPEQVEKTWILIKRLHLDEGLHKINLQIPSLELFKGVVEIPTKRPTPYLNVRDGIYTLTAQGEKNCVVFPFKNLISGTPYRVSFKHRRTAGDQNLRVFISQQKTELLPLTKSGDFLSGATLNRDYRLDVQLRESNELFVNICTEIYRDPLYTQNTRIEISDVSVRKLSSQIFVFERSPKSKNKEESKISFNKINQTKYKVNIQDAVEPFFVTFSQRYSKDWAVYFDDSESQTNILSTFISPSGLFSVANLIRESLPEKNHFISNTYANSWYIDKKGDSKIIVEYKGQLRFYVASFITIVVFIASIALLLKKRKKGEKN